MELSTTSFISLGIHLMEQRLRFIRPFPIFCGPEFFFLGLLCVLSSYALSPDNWQVLGFFAIIGLLIASYRIVLISRSNSDQILSNVFFTFISAFSMFFLIGPLVEVFGHPDEIEYTTRFFSTSADRAVMALGANLIGFGVSLMIGGSLRFRAFTKNASKHFSYHQKINILQISVWLVLIGIIFKAYVLYNDLYALDTIFGSTRLLQLLMPVGSFLYFKEYNFDLKPISIFFICASLFYSLGGFLEFNKSEILYPLIAIVGGLLIRNMTLVRLVRAVAGFGMILVILQQTNTAARNESLDKLNLTLSERIRIYEGAFRNNFENTELQNIGIWSRLDYTTQNVAAMSLYDHGDGGESYKLIPWIFVPRLLFPDKPIMTNAGVNFNNKVRGSETTSTGLGVFISGYYDFGWFGLISVSVLVGFILAWYRSIIIAAQYSQSTTLLVIGLVGHFTAFHVSGDYMANYLGTTVTVLYFFVITQFFFRIQRSRMNIRGGI